MLVYPECSSKNLAVVVAFFSFAILFFAMPRDINMYDEGIILSNAMRVIQGDVIHRDFYSLYGPGQYYVVAAIFQLFGEHFIAERIYDLVVRSAVLFTLFYIICKQCQLLIALIFTAVGGMWFLGIASQFYLYPIYPCMLLSLIGSFLVTRVGEGPLVSPAIIGAGACTGLTALFRYDVGFLLLIAHLFSIVVLSFLLDPCEARVRRILTAAVAYGVGTAVVFAPVAIVFLLASPIKDFLADIVGYGLNYYPVMRGLPFPSLNVMRSAPHEVAVYLPLLAAGLALLELVPLIRRRIKGAASHPKDDFSVAYLTVFGSTACLLFLKGLVRVQALHMLLGIVPALIVFAILANLWWQRGSVMRSAAVVVLLLSAYPAAVSAKRELVESVRVVDRSIGGWLAVRAGLITPTAAEVCEAGPASGIARLNPDYARVATYLGAHTDPAEHIFVALDRHDKIFINPISLYFAAGRLPGTHWHQFDPGLQTRTDIQKAIVDDLQRNNVRWIVRDGNYNEVMEPNGSARSSSVTLLDRYIEKHYRAVASSGKVAIWLANAEPPIDASFIGKCEARPVPREP